MSIFREHRDLAVFLGKMSIQQHHNKHPDVEGTTRCARSCSMCSTTLVDAIDMQVLTGVVDLCR